MRLDTGNLHSFLLSWYGPADRMTGDVPRVEHGVELPAPMREWYELIPQWSECSRSHNELLDSKDVYISEGKYVFWLENQGVCAWGIDLNDDDPEVFFLEDDITRWRCWERTGVQLSTFLVHAAIFEAQFSAPYTIESETVNLAQRSELLALLEPIPAMEWSYPSPETRFHHGDGVIAFDAPDASEDEPVLENRHWWVSLGAREPRWLRAALSIPGIEWEILRDGRGDTIGSRSADLEFEGPWDGERLVRRWLA